MDVREEIINSLRKEIVGPSPNPNYLDEDSGEEILLTRIHGSPKSKYGAGMLYPQQTVNNEEVDSGGDGIDVQNNLGEQNLNTPSFEESNNARNNSNVETGSSDEEPVGLANQYLPSAMGFTVRFNASEKNDKIVVKVNSAFYERGAGQKTVKKITKDGAIETIIKRNNEPLVSDFHIRRPIKIEPVELNINSLFDSNKRSFSIILQKNHNQEDWLKLQIYNRTSIIDEKDDLKTFTFVIINASGANTDTRINSRNILYQNQLSISVENENLIAPYRERYSSTDTDEEKELNLLYRNKRIFAIGHGTAVTWNDSNGKVEEVVTSVIPVYEIRQVAPTAHVELSMYNLSDFGNWSEAKKSLQGLSLGYKGWIAEIEKEANGFPKSSSYKEAAKLNIEKCKHTLERINKGIKLLEEADEDSNIVKCFRWMNRAMVWQQQRSKTKQRKWIKTKVGKETNYSLEGINEKDKKEFPSLLEYHDSSKYNGRWRPFQIAFILMNLESIVNPHSNQREIVDLIWFPTGGGKTEAYLGLAAFTIFYRRIKGSEDLSWDVYGGTSILMRYTLRLLTTQQYERASSLMCACELIRQEKLSELGTDLISIGLWVGSASTPNKNDSARTQFNILQKDKYQSYNFIVMKCPCCGSQIGKLDSVQKYDKIKTKGLEKEDGRNGKIVFRCENTYCEFHSSQLPLSVVDEYIYENPPTLLIGTVDKFAMLPWKKEAGNLFGFREMDNGEWTRINPPELIIQDELHLISGPLGTMVGLYETMVQTLCNNYNKTKPPFISLGEKTFIPPKIVSSSATISRAKEQVKNLYGTDNLHIFPSQGLEFGNTWFSVEKDYEDLPGRKYVGVLASGYPSAQTSIVRAYSSVLQKVKELDQEKSIGYYWTLMGYFNSIRELGGASSLVFGDIRERLGQIQNRDLLPFDNRRRLQDWKILELTSRISSDEIPVVLKKLETDFQLLNNKATDICLATNMVATGVDISRLGLMFVHGQPKTTAEYIQASSRVGRKGDGPGLIFTLYSPSKPRDKSQYEQFQGYHSRIYSNVEPTSVTPFSINARERGLHALLIGLVRHFSSQELRESPRHQPAEFDELVKIMKKVILERCEIVDSDEVLNTSNLIDRRINFWKKGFQHYGDAGNFGILKNTEYYPLMYSSSTEVKQEIINDKRSLPTPTSMRGVDSESEINIISNTESNGE